MTPRLPFPPIAQINSTSSVNKKRANNLADLVLDQVTINFL